MTEMISTQQVSDRDKAVRLLTQARDLLVQRLTQSVLDLGEDLLEDARGESFSGEIDTLHEQIGGRLNQVNVLLAGLTLPDDAEPESTRRQPVRGAAQADLPEFEIERTRMPQLADESPSAGSIYPNSTYPLFVQDIVRRDIVTAARRLAAVLGTTPEQAEVYASRFREQLDRDAAFLAKVHTLRKALNIEELGLCRVLLRECFGLQGSDCEAALQLFRGWL